MHGRCLHGACPLLASPPSLWGSSIEHGLLSECPTIRWTPVSGTSPSLVSQRTDSIVRLTKRVTFTYRLRSQPLPNSCDRDRSSACNILSSSLSVNPFNLSSLSNLLLTASPVTTFSNRFATTTSPSNILNSYLIWNLYSKSKGNETA